MAPASRLATAATKGDVLRSEMARVLRANAEDAIGATIAAGDLHVHAAHASVGLQIRVDLESRLLGVIGSDHRRSRTPLCSEHGCWAPSKSRPSRPSSVFQPKPARNRSSLSPGSNSRILTKSADNVSATVLTASLSSLSRSGSASARSPSCASASCCLARLRNSPSRLPVRCWRRQIHLLSAPPADRPAEFPPLLPGRCDRSRSCL